LDNNKIRLNCGKIKGLAGIKKKWIFLPLLLLRYPPRSPIRQGTKNG